MYNNDKTSRNFVKMLFIISAGGSSASAYILSGIEILMTSDAIAAEVHKKNDILNIITVIDLPLVVKIVY
jgi:hypothetical protein